MLQPSGAPAPHRLRVPAPAVLLALLAVALLAALAPAARAAETPAGVPPAVVAPLGDGRAALVPYEELVAAADDGRLSAAVIDEVGFWVAAIDRDGRVVAARIPEPERGRDYGRTSEARDAVAASPRPGVFDLEPRLRESGVAVLRAAPAAAASTPSDGGPARVVGLVLMLMLIGVVVLMVVRSRGGGGRGIGGRGGAHGRIRKSAIVAAPATRFTDVAGCDEAVTELEEAVTFLREPERFSRVGARMPRGVILHGPPGTGKTLLAKAVAGESGVPFYALSGSDFVDTYVGVGAARVRDLFTEARKQERGAIIFFDEIDAIGRARGGGAGGGADAEREGTLNQLLVELDGFGARDRLVVIAATNRVDMLDAALTRPGRFDRRVQVGLPAERGRLEILRLHSAHMPIEDPSELEALARVTAGFAGADLSNILNEAAIMAARDGRAAVTGADLDEGMLRAVAGPRKADRRLAEGELETIAWHEAGHALAAELCPTHEKTQRVSILSRGDAGGLALYGRGDRALTSQQHLHERMVVAMAGRAAEEVGFGVISSGAANDLEQVNAMARDAVERLGFSPRVGQMVASAGQRQMPLSAETRRVIDEEIGRMVADAYREAVSLLAHHREELDALGAALLEHEQIDRRDIERLLAGVSAPEGRRRPAAVDALPGGPPARAPEPRPAAVLPAPRPRAGGPAGPAAPGRRRSRRVIPGRMRAGLGAATATLVGIPSLALRRAGATARTRRAKGLRRTPGGVA